MSLRLPDSGAEVMADGRRVAPSAARNAAAILGVLRRVIAPRARVLELASGTGQHAAEFAPALAADWQPSDVRAGNFASIAAWAGGGVRPAVVLDACAPGWAAGAGWDAILAVNLLHLIPEAGVEVLIAEAARALAPGGRLVIYGPFLRDGRATSAGDAARGSGGGSGADAGEQPDAHHIHGLIYVKASARCACHAAEAKKECET